MKGARKVFTSLLALLFVAGCGGRFDYVRPVGPGMATNSVIVEKSADDVWRGIASALDADHFDGVGLDKDSGVLMFGYRGDPERYVDCGHIRSFVKNLRGERIYTFPAAAASTEYELMTGKEILFVARQMAVDIRLTATVARIGARQTRVSVDARYALTRTMMTRDTRGRARTTLHTIHFTSGQEAAFPGTVTCRPSGRLEMEVLSASAK
ncbi:MAG: hypothetical protein A2Z31_10555 [candidate division NC10 bacterium RBG_16_65_8]|nr:MAG: hypothetical protein A2Z31_10555 [candidate division NC10 bacterium RBG_16_65_8]